ncbi:MULTISPECIES: hypothetical protein [unclassified Rhizobium]|uniref:hypothetical protein n=1 Tax=unclassified Rhizobium TaxID=2613769 RepID=UPI001ADC3367|nr:MULTISPECIES: hypothetical protein [unclassified Rhizobium]MBO9125493.1 hypothetical protein [Rhizobium sp. 16-488-2b]MBO9176078.1 hypothetical protein [Rhizobium sp. 16-488-2a]
MSKTAPGKQKNLMGNFPAKLAWALEPIAEYAENDLRFWDGSLFMEPAPEGGAFIGAASSHAMAVFHAQDAWCNSAMTFRMPHEAFRAAEPRYPVEMTYCGEHFAVDVPEWMQPGTIWVTNAGMFIQPKMRAPCFAEEAGDFYPVLFDRTASVGHHHVGIDYTATEGVKVEWRRPLIKAGTEASGAPIRSFAANPGIISLLERVFDLAIAESPPEAPPAIFHRPTGTDEQPGPVLVTITDRPDIVATYMPLKIDGKTAPTIPWNFLKPPAEQNSEANDAA